MGDAQTDVTRSHTFCVLARRAMKNNCRPAARHARHFNIPPAHALAPARTQSFHCGLLGREASRIALGFIPVPFAVCDLGRSINPLEEGLAVPFDCFVYPANLLHVQAKANNHFACLLGGKFKISATEADYTAPLPLC